MFACVYVYLNLFCLSPSIRKINSSFVENEGWPISRTLSRDSYCLLYTSYSLLTVCPGFLIITVKPRKKKWKKSAFHGRVITTQLTL